MRMPDSIRKLPHGHTSRLQWVREQSSAIYAEYREGKIDSGTAIRKQEELLSAAQDWPRLSLVR